MELGRAQTSHDERTLNFLKIEKYDIRYKTKLKKIAT